MLLVFLWAERGGRCTVSLMFEEFCNTRNTKNSPRGSIGLGRRREARPRARVGPYRVVESPAGGGLVPREVHAGEDLAERPYHVVVVGGAVHLRPLLRLLLGEGGGGDVLAERAISIYVVGV